MTEISERLAMKDPQFHALLADILAELRSRLPKEPTPADVERVLDEMELEQRERHEQQLTEAQEFRNRIGRPYALFSFSLPSVMLVSAIVVAAIVVAVIR